MMVDFMRVGVGDIVVRNMCGILMELKVTEVTDDLIICDLWEFDRDTGKEIDCLIPATVSHLTEYRPA